MCLGEDSFTVIAAVHNLTCESGPPMKNLLSVSAILLVTVCGSSASASGLVKAGVGVKLNATGKAYRVHGVLRQNAHLVRAAVVSNGRAGNAAESPAETGVVSMDAVDVADASQGYDAAALGTDHHVRCLIAVEQADAVIYVDGARAGTSPVEVDWDGRATEQHTLRVQKDGMVSYEQTFSQGVGDAAIYVRLLPAESK
jgi:hypothetical protein